MMMRRFAVGSRSRDHDDRRQVRTPLAELILVGLGTTAWLVAVVAVFVLPARYPKFPIDAYYYLEMARNFASGRGLSVRFEQGVPVKFFPGYPFLLGLFSFAAEPHEMWQCVHAGLAGALLVGGLVAARMFGQSRAIAWATLALTFASPVFLKWATLPYSELLTVTLGVWLVVLLVLVIRQGHWLWALGAGLLAGWAAVTRPTGAFYAIAATVAIVRTRGEGRWRLVACFLASAALLPLGYLVWKYASSGHALPYWSEWLNRPSSDSPINRLLDDLLAFVALRTVSAPHPLIDHALVVGNFVFFASLLLGCRGYVGRDAMVAGWLVLAFLLAHSLWRYSSERFIIPVLPAGMFALARFLEWFLDRRRTRGSHPRPASLGFALLVGSWCAVMWLYAPAVVTNHIEALRVNTGRPHEMATVANSDPHGTAWVEIGPEFAYFYAGRTYFDREEPFFYRRVPEFEAGCLGEAQLRWVVTRDTPQQWLARHALGTTWSAQMHWNLALDDGFWKLYRIEWHRR